MTQVINLRRMRKQAARAKARQAGTEQAARFGQTRVERVQEAARAERAAQHLDGHRVERPRDETLDD